MKSPARLLAFAGFGLLTSVPVGTIAADGDTVIVARTRPDIVLIWRINDVLASANAAHLDEEGVRRALLARAVEIARTHAKRDERIVVQLVYERVTNDPRYKIDTVSGIARIGSVSANGRELIESGGRWEKQLAAGRQPSRLLTTIDSAALNDVNAGG